MSEPSLHEHYMRRCFELAQRAIATNDAPVGALVVFNGRVVAEAVEGVRARRDVTAHAEILALRAASDVLGALDLTGCALYTSVEPCVMCAYAIRLARVTLVVSGARSSDAERALNGWTVLSSAEALPDRAVPVIIRDVTAGE